jgi:hypothetical protein
MSLRVLRKDKKDNQKNVSEVVIKINTGQVYPAPGIGQFSHQDQASSFTSLYSSACLKAKGVELSLNNQPLVAGSVFISPGDLLTIKEDKKETIFIIG